MTKTQGFPQDLYWYLGPKWVFGSGGWTKNDMDFQQPQVVYFVEKYDELSESVALGQKLRYFTEQNGPKG